MTAADAGFLVASVTAIGAAITALMRYRLIAAIFALIACAAVLFDFVDRRWLTPQLPVESQVSPDNAILDVQTWTKGTPSADLPRYFVNAQIINSGKTTALGLQHIGSVSYADGPVDPAFIRSLFLTFKTQLKLIPSADTGEIRPGNNHIWYSVLGPPQKDEVTKNLAGGKNILLVFNVMRYRDDRIAKDQFIYTENCIYFVKEIVHFCESGPNRTYISN